MTNQAQSRDIKFRSFGRIQLGLFGPPTEQMWIPCFIDKEGRPCRSMDYEPPFHYDDHKVMQFTGLQDKNGVDVYEGDVVIYFPAKEMYADELVVNEVVWDNFKSQWKLSRYTANYYNGHDMEVIGNIYENKDLLNVD